MGIFDSIKKSMGMSSGEFELRIQPETCHVDGELRGEALLRAHKELNVFAVELELWHIFPDEWGHLTEEGMERELLAERVSIGAQDHATWPFHFELPAHLAPSLGKFGWKLKAEARLQGSSSIKKELELDVGLSPIMSTVHQLVEQEFGFSFREAGADEDGIWMTYRPQGAVKGMYDGLELAFDEGEDELVLWVALDRFHPRVVERYAHAFDEHEGSIEFEIDKADYAVGREVDRQGLLGLLRPLFSP